MTERNDQGREVWFERIAWSYMPAHWKGVVYPAAIIAIVVPLCLLANRYSPDLFVIPLIFGWALVMWLCSRHSPSRR
jgi:hypothetical protein